MKITVVSAASKCTSQLVVLFAHSATKKNETTAHFAGKFPAELDKNNITENVPATFKGEEGQSAFYRGLKGKAHVLVLGTGTAKKFSSENARRWSATILKCAKQEQVKAIRVCAPNSLTAEAAITGFTEGLLLANYKFTAFKAADKNDVPVENVEISVEKFSAALSKVAAASTIIAEATNFARYLGDCPGNFMTPTQLSKEAHTAAAGTKMKVTVWDKARIAKEKMDSFLGVSLGSEEEPRFIIMEYKGGNAKQKPFCLVGKGLTFDSGGISIKPSAGMEEMKFDMCGGAAVIAAMSAIAKLKLNINAIGLVAATENMPGPLANKPGDIRKARNGKSIEINNTDAEGRLILADALVYACEQKPGMILDAATLTGAMMIALGNTHTGFFSRNEALVKKVNAAATECGEAVWHMPMTDDHVKDMKGYYADLTNLAPSRNAGSATAAAFLESFVEKDIPWAHFDIAGTAWNVSGRLPYICTKGASGAIVRTFIEMAQAYK
ncbi:MAG: leucyl aminopeptidase [Bdellovibrionaceae bacterium]|nr:leucyl aminopeptidase [Pseudobdellovibrionaceae bacterium]